MSLIPRFDASAYDKHDRIKVEAVTQPRGDNEKGYPNTDLNMVCTRPTKSSSGNSRRIVGTNDVLKHHLSQQKKS
jgi:hypothetical protein